LDGRRDIPDQPQSPALPAKIAIIGVGLMGGSVGMAALRRNVVREVIGIHPDSDPPDVAMRLGATTGQTYVIEEGVADVDLVVICTPASEVAVRGRVAAAHCQPTTVMTDVASTKSQIVQAMDALWPQFVGGHPLTGSHASGIEAARADLFEGQRVVLTPTAATDESALQYVKRFWEALGAATLRLTPAAHDQALAATSHLPHWVAAALAASTPPEYFPLVAGGWKDTTRIAAGNVEMWRDILMQNREHLLAAHERFVGKLDQFRQALEAGNVDALIELLEQGKQNRNAVGS
jgi:prephenate dehydrogenase